MWIFGYGSLIWKTQFPYKKKVVGYVKGFKRRFWWWSEDHRGVPGAPGRVVNLLPGEDEDRVYGVAYEIDDNDWEEGVRDQLDHREKGGYTQHLATFYPGEGQEASEQQVTLYLGQITHRQYAGPDSLDAMASTILSSVGPSGENKEYLYRLAQALRELVPSIRDTHVEQLEARVRVLEEETEAQG